MSTAIYWAKCLALDGFMFALAAAGLVWHISGAWDVFIFWNWVLVALALLIAFSPVVPKFEPRRPYAGIYHFATEVLAISILVLAGHPIAGVARLIAAILIEGKHSNIAGSVKPFGISEGEKPHSGGGVL